MQATPYGHHHQPHITADIASKGLDHSRQIAYTQEIYQMFQSQDFAQATAEVRKEIVGTAIYKHVSSMVGEEHAPKVTGMIIDLDPVELNMSIQAYADLQAKVNSAMQLLLSNNLLSMGGVDSGSTPKSEASSIEKQHDGIK